MLNYYGAHTGRFSGGDKVNLQNLPRGGALRKALAAPDGKVVVACDSSQIEARLVAYLAGQDDLVQSFREGRDVYSEFATDVYNRPITKGDKVERHVGKTCILGLGYGMGAAKFQHSLATGFISVEVDENEAQKIVHLYRNKYHRIQAFWNRCNHMLGALATGGTGEISDLIKYDPEGIILPNGMYIRYPALRRKDNGYEYINDPRTYRKVIRDRIHGAELSDLPWTNIYGGKVVENITQAVARIVVAEQMVKIGRRYPVALQVHDEIVCVVDEEIAEDCRDYMVEVMSTPPKWAPDLPVACEADMGPNYGDAK
jgi:DNA polymerase